eukprot:8392194-Ditylum_brightwellii.AAC.1
MRCKHRKIEQYIQSRVCQVMINPHYYSMGKTGVVPKQGLSCELLPPGICIMTPNWSAGRDNSCYYLSIWPQKEMYP